MPPSSLKQRQTERYQEVYRKVIADGKKRIPPGPGWAAAMDRLHQKANLAAHEAMCEFIAVETTPFTPVEVPGSSNGLSLLSSSSYVVPTLPRATNIFHSVVLGENEKAFRLLELTVNTMREKGSTLPLLLVGPPSCGKTTTAQIVARALDRPFLPLSAGTLNGDLFELVDGQMTQLHARNPFSEVYKHPDNPMPVKRIKPTTIFVDEAHALTDKAQTLLLQTMEKPFLLSRPDGSYVDFRDVLVILGTTDPTLTPGGGGLVKPLRTRCVNGGIVFVPYSAESVAEMLRRVNPRVTQEEALLAAKTAKLYPRVALGYVAQAGSMPLRTFLHDLIGADEHGLDPVDRQLLAVLEESVEYKHPKKIAESEAILAEHEAGRKISPLRVLQARTFLDTTSPKPMSIDALASALMVTDHEDIKARIHYLQSLKMVVRTPRGVVRQK